MRRRRPAPGAIGYPRSVRRPPRRPGPLVRGVLVVLGAAVVLAVDGAVAVLGTLAACPSAEPRLPLPPAEPAADCAAVVLRPGLAVGPTAPAVLPGIELSGFDASLAALGLVTVAAILTILVTRAAVTARSDFAILGALWGAALAVAGPPLVLGEPAARVVEVAGLPVGPGDLVLAWAGLWCLVRLAFERLAPP